VSIVPNRRTVLENQVVVYTIKSRGGSSRHVTEVNVEAKPLLSANGGGFTDAACNLLTTTPTSASFTVSVRVRSSSGSLSSEGERRLCRDFVANLSHDLLEIDVGEFLCQEQFTPCSCGMFELQSRSMDLR
jgi:hypothetical protein